jgi:hypothetical protein
MGSAASVFPHKRWEEILGDGERFLDRWLDRAEGWSQYDLFGLHPEFPAERYDCMGLIPLLAGREVIELTAAAATVLTKSGAKLTYTRPTAPTDTCIWHLAEREKNRHRARAVALQNRWSGLDGTF